LTTWWEQALDRSSRDGCCTGTSGLHINLTQNRWRLARHVKAGGNVRRPNWAPHRYAFVPFLSMHVLIVQVSLWFTWTWMWVLWQLKRPSKSMSR
jgi:hypothetical protein